MLKYSKKEIDCFFGLKCLLNNKKKSVNKNHLLKSKKQILILQHVFNRNMYPSTELRHDLSTLLNHSQRSIQIWFQNKRQLFRSKYKNIKKSAYTGKKVDFNELLLFFFVKIV